MKDFERIDRVENEIKLIVELLKETKNLIRSMNDGQHEINLDIIKIMKEISKQ